MAENNHFYNPSEELKKREEALLSLLREEPQNKAIKNELYAIQGAIENEKELFHQIDLLGDTSAIVLNNIHFKSGSYFISMDYVVVTPLYTYFICTNDLIGKRISVNKQGEFKRDLRGKDDSSSIPSPILKGEAAKKLLRLIRRTNQCKKIESLLGDKPFGNYRKVLCLVGKHTEIDKSECSAKIQNAVIPVSSFAGKIQYDIHHKSDNEKISDLKEMESISKAYLEVERLYKEDNQIKEVDYEDYYRKAYMSHGKGEQVIGPVSYEEAIHIIRNLRDQKGVFYSGGNSNIGRLSVSYGNQKKIGMKSKDNLVEYRMDYDPEKGVHFNYEDKENEYKLCIVIKGWGYPQYQKYIDKLDKVHIAQTTSAIQEEMERLKQKQRPVIEDDDYQYSPNTFLVREEYRTSPNPYDDTVSKKIHKGKYK